jgi:tRNA(Arg) A34 adenosine deaminase TadA
MNIPRLRLLPGLLPLFAASVAFAADPVVAPVPDDPACTAEDRKFMARAYEFARKSLARGDNAIGAVLVKDGKIICESGNSIYTDRDLTQHGETGLISHASPVLEKSLWEGSTLYTSLEPCIMCCGSMHAAGIKTVVYGGTSRQANGELFGPQRLRVREIYQRYGWKIEVRGPLMDEEQLKIRAETAARNAKRKG